MRGDPATQIDPLNLPEFIIRQNGGELQGLIEGGRKTGSFEIVEGEVHEQTYLVAASASAAIFHVKITAFDRLRRIAEWRKVIATVVFQVGDNAGVGE
jgi:hypothetical protein